MNGLRFKVGELAIIACAIHPENQGKVVEILAVGPYQIGDIVVHPSGAQVEILSNTDYFIDVELPNCTAKDYQLRKIDPPTEPASLTRESECEVEA